MKNLIFKGSAILILFVLTSYTVADYDSKAKNLIGTWEYAIPDAPYQYQKGFIIFEKKDSELSGFFSVDGFKTPLQELKSQKNKVTFETYVEGVTVTFDLTFKKKSFEGTVSYSEGTLDISGNKKID